MEIVLGLKLFLLEDLGWLGIGALLVEDPWVWPRERAQKRLEEREKIGRKKERVGPVTVINWDPHEFSPDLNPDWIQKQANG